MKFWKTLICVLITQYCFAQYCFAQKGEGAKISEEAAIKIAKRSRCYIMRKNWEEPVIIYSPKEKRWYISTQKKKVPFYKGETDYYTNWTH